MTSAALMYVISVATYAKVSDVGHREVVSCDMEPLHFAHSRRRRQLLQKHSLSCTLQSAPICL
jgi:hypothetical protein